MFKAFKLFQRKKDITCRGCNGYGWILGHEEDCLSKEYGWLEYSCECGIVRVKCNECIGCGRNKKLDALNREG